MSERFFVALIGAISSFEFGLYYKLEKEGRVERIVNDDSIEHAMHHPPETTRAKFRGRFVKLANERKILCGVNWSYIQLYEYEPYQKLFLSTDPLQAEYEEASRMIYSI
jgi:proteasome accessory factor A